MGNYLNVPSSKNLDKTSTNSIKKIKTVKCFEVFDDYYKTYYPRVDLDEEEFDNIFSPIINDTKMMFK